MHCNLRLPQPRQPFRALITTPCQVWSHSTYPVQYYSVFAADTLLYAVTLTFDLWPWNICSVSPVMWWNCVPKLNAIEQSAAELLRFECLTLWPWIFGYRLLTNIWPKHVCIISAIDGPLAHVRNDPLSALLLSPTFGISFVSCFDFQHCTFAGYVL